MQRESGRRNEMFGVSDPFAAFSGIGMMPSLFGGRDPFDDPFFARPFGSILDSSMFDPPSSTSEGASHINREKGVVIQELGSDDERDMEEIDDKCNHQRKHSDLSKEPSIEHPDDEDGNDEETKAKKLNNYAEREGVEPRVGRYGFHTRKVTYGGLDGAYYTSTRTRRTGGDGVVMEESTEANATTGQATHRLSRGIHDKGHSVTRKLNSDGKVDTTQTLHNLHEDEFTGFEEAWRRNFKAQLPGWSNQFGSDSSNRYQGTRNNANTAVPAIEQARQQTSEAMAESSAARMKKVTRINID